MYYNEIMQGLDSNSARIKRTINNEGGDTPLKYPESFYVVEALTEDGITALQIPVKFQCGPIPEHGVNGLTNEQLLRILIDRTNRLDEKFPSSYNGRAMSGMLVALESFESRTRDRIVRGVEGKEIK